MRRVSIPSLGEKGGMDAQRCNYPSIRSERKEIGIFFRRLSSRPIAESNVNPFDFFLFDGLLPAVVELGRSRRVVPGDVLGSLQLPSVLQVGLDPGPPKRMTGHRVGIEARLLGPTLHHLAGNFGMRRRPVNSLERLRLKSDDCLAGCESGKVRSGWECGASGSGTAKGD